MVQATQATVGGTVRDAVTGEPLVGAVVALTDLDRATTTDAQGRYVLHEVPPGPQHLAVRLLGYAQRSMHALVPRDGELEINIALRPEPVPLAALDVHARGMVPIRGMEGGDSTPFPDRKSSIAAVWNHPLLAEPDVFQALGGGEVVLEPESPSGMHIRGGASDQTAYLLDGIPVFSPYHAAGVFSAWNPDALSWLHLSSTAPSPAYPDALSGAMVGVSRTPGSRFRAQGGVSTTQTRLTVDGPLGVAGVSYLASLRWGLPNVLAPNEASYLRGETGDWLVKLEAPAFGGRVRLLGYDSDNEIKTTSGSRPVLQPSGGSRGNLFEWHSRSLGAAWWRTFSNLVVRVVGWSAAGDAGAAWAAQSGPVDMTAARRDLGFVASMERRTAGASTVAGIRAEHIRTFYRTERDGDSAPTASLGAGTPVPTVFAQHARTLGHGVNLDVGASLAVAQGEVLVGPRTQLRWTPAEPLTLSASYARAHQFAQSLRNPESVVGTVFPADLYVGAGSPGIPIARSDQVVIAADYRPVSGVRLSVQAYERGSDGLVLVAPRAGDPFATGAFATGSGASRGVSVEAVVSTARYGLIASYGFQRTRLHDGESSYVPDFSATHLFDGGAIVYPSATASIRLGASAALGRRTTPVSGGFEWESCNLIDRGCEFVGTPLQDPQALGVAALPLYLRVDLSVRKHWHFEIGGRDGTVALFGTVTNVFNRKNLLTYARDPSTGELTGIDMRPRAPLVVGLDWRF